MRTFKCCSCDHAWQLPFGTGGPGIGLTCPECVSENIHRVLPGRGGGRGRRFGRSDVEMRDGAWPRGGGHGGGRWRGGMRVNPGLDD